MRMKTLLAGLVVLAVAGSLRAETSQTLTLPIDYATFYIPSDSTIYIELYYSLYRHQLGFIGSDKNDYRYAGVLVSADIFDEEGNAIDTASTYFLSQVRSPVEQEMKDVRLFDYLPIPISPGQYRIVVSAIDDVSKATGETVITAAVPDYAAASLASSDLELAYEIRDLTEGTSSAVNQRLVKEDRLVIPNPTGVYDITIDTALFVYSEVYGLSPPQDSGFTVRYLIKDSSGNVVHDYGLIRYEKPGESAVLSSSLDIRSLAPGSYFLFLEAIDLGSGEQAMATHRFSVYGPEIRTSRREDVQLMTNIAWYHLSEAEKMQLGKLSDEGKINLIRQFWRTQDDDPSNPENPVYDAAVRRYRYAIEQFSTDSLRQNGWRTDRGRIYMTYGEYDDEYEEVMTGKSYPYIVWRYYQLEGGVVFVFVNDFVAGAADYRLVHSTHPREKYDPQWESILLDASQQEEDWRGAGDKEF